MSAKLLGLVVCLALIDAHSARAATYTYTYAGNPLTECSGPGCVQSPPYPVITASFTMASPLSANLALGAITPLSWEITDGTSVLTNSNSTLNGSLEIATNSGGGISEWDFYAQVLGNPAKFIGMYTSGYLPPPATFYGEDASYETFTVRGTIINNANFNDPGSWSLTITPVPAALPLFATALGGLGLLGWRRKRRAATAA